MCRNSIGVGSMGMQIYLNFVSEVVDFGAVDVVFVVFSGISRVAVCYSSILRTDLRTAELVLDFVFIFLRMLGWASPDLA